MNKTEEFDERLDVAGFSKEERKTIKLVSKESGLMFVEYWREYGDWKSSTSPIEVE